MLEYYTEESAAELLLEVTGGRANDCSVLAACLNAAIAKIQANYTPGDKRIEVGDYIVVGDYVEVRFTDTCLIRGYVVHEPIDVGDYWIIKEFDGSICYCERPLYVRRQAI